MASDLTELTEIERDAISEIANMGVSRAAASLRQMVGEQVLLSVPNVRIVSRQEAAGLVERGSPNLVAVQQSFEGPFSGRALLIFPQAQSLELVRSIVGAEHSLEDIIDLEQEALAETGNIILNACLATIANVLAGRASRHPLSDREIEVLTMIVRGQTNKEIASGLGISENTVKFHTTRIFEKLGVMDRVQAATAAISRGIVHLG